MLAHHFQYSSIYQINIYLSYMTNDLHIHTSIQKMNKYVRMKSKKSMTMNTDQLYLKHCLFS